MNGLARGRSTLGVIFILAFAGVLLGTWMERPDVVAVAKPLLIITGIFWGAFVLLSLFRNVRSL